MHNNEGQIIPNVSTVYRQLVQINQFNPRLNQTQNNNFKQSYSKTNNNFNVKKIPDKIDFIMNMQQDDRQKRHQQLMNRFKNSFQQNRQIFGINQAPKIDNYINNNQIQRRYSKQSLYSNPLSNNYSSSSYQTSTQFNNTNLNNQFNQKSQANLTTKWVPPKIKYRHIEDFKQKNIQKNDIQTNNIKIQQKQKGLKEDFYGTGMSNKSYQQQSYNNNQEKQSKVNKNGQSQTQRVKLNNLQRDQQEKYNRMMNNSKQPSKYNDRLQSYYNVCRKSVKQTNSSMNQSKQQTTEFKKTADKFTRRPVPKVQGYNIEKALQILSFD